MSRDDCRRCTYHRPFRPFRGAAPYVRIHTDTSGLAALGCLHCQLGWRIELFTRHTGHLFAFGFCLRDRGSSQELQTCDDACVQWLSPPFELRNATHRLPFTCRLLNGVSRQRPHSHASATSRSAPSPSPTRLGCLAPPLAMWLAVGLVVRSAPPVTLQRLMFPFRASEPPLFPRHTALP